MQRKTLNSLSKRMLNFSWRFRKDCHYMMLLEIHLGPALGWQGFCRSLEDQGADSPCQPREAGHPPAPCLCPIFPHTSDCPLLSPGASTTRPGAQRLCSCLSCPNRWALWALLCGSALFSLTQEEIWTHSWTFSPKVQQVSYNKEALSPREKVLCRSLPGQHVCCAVAETLHTLYLHTHTHITHDTTLHTHSGAHTSHTHSPAGLAWEVPRTASWGELGVAELAALWRMAVDTEPSHTLLRKGQREPLTDSWAQLSTHRVLLPSCPVLPTTLHVAFASDLPPYFLPWKQNFL